LNFLSQSSLTQALANNDEYTPDEGESSRILAEKKLTQEEALSAINERIIALQQTIIGLQGNTVNAGDAPTMIKTPTMTIIMQRDFWAVLKHNLVSTGDEIEYYEESEEEMVCEEGEECEEALDEVECEEGEECEEEELPHPECEEGEECEEG
jgi:hypothetical protein